MTQSYDLAVLGGGPGGYVSAIRASQLGLRVALIEKKHLGGTCLHNGCIPSKAMLRSAEIFRQTKLASEFGVDSEKPTLNFFNVQKRKNKIINTLHKGVQGLMRKNKIDVYNGIGRLLGPSIFSPIAGSISIEYDNGEENDIITPKNVLIATGSKPNILADLKVDGTYVLTSDEALHMENLPTSMIIVGGGVIGIEWASMLVDFGVDVTVIEAKERILPTEDEDISKEIEKQLKQKGVTFITNAKVLPETLETDGAVTIDVKTSDQQKTLTGEKLLVSIGRKANTKNIGLENTEVIVKDGYIQTNEFYQTKEAHIYAIGDCIGGMQLAHVASHEGVIAVEHIAGEQPFLLSEQNVPSCIYSHPEAASIGMTEQQAKDAGYDISVGKLPFQTNGKALVYGDTQGFVKIIANKKNNDVLGIHMIGPLVTEMISEASLAKLLDATPWEISDSIHPHPTLSETVGEAALAVDGLQIHG